MMLLNIAALALVAAGAWWLTGLDTTVAGESKRTYYVSRIIRCVIILYLAGAFLWFLEQPKEVQIGSLYFLIIVPPALALLLRSSVSELFTHGFFRLLDPSLYDNRELDAGKSRRYMDTIAHLIKNGRRDEAIRLCEELKLSGEVEVVTLENTLEFLGVKQARPARARPLAEAAGLRTQGKFAEAEQLLKSLRAKDPGNPDAAMLLMRLYAQDLHQPGKAAEVLREIEKQPHVAAAHIEFARRSIDEWSRTPAAAKREPALPPRAASVDELLAGGGFGTAIEILEEQLRLRPDDFDLRLKLAEVYGRHCGNLHRAEKIIREIETHAGFSPEQIQAARKSLQDWRAAGPGRAT